MTTINAPGRDALAEIDDIESTLHELYQQATFRGYVAELIGISQLARKGIFDKNHVAAFGHKLHTTRTQTAREREFLDMLATVERRLARLADTFRGQLHATLEPAPLEISDTLFGGETHELKSGGTFIHASRLMHAQVETAKRFAKKDVSMLLTGETGTGKEMLARLVHEESGSEGPFVGLNVGAVPENLLESELFGHEKGAFTGAIVQHKGKFEQASGGTFLLDEIGDLPPHTQVKLLRVLQEKTFERVGGSVTLPMNARMIFATKQNLLHMKDNGKFRDDLYYRVTNGIELPLPALRERADKPLLIHHFLTKLDSKATLAPDAEHILFAFRFPGNVRQLEAVISGAYTRASIDQEKAVIIKAEHILAASAEIRASAQALRDTRLPTQWQKKTA